MVVLLLRTVPGGLCSGDFAGSGTDGKAGIIAVRRGYPKPERPTLRRLALRYGWLSPVFS